MTRPAGPSPASSLAAVLRDPLRETAQPVHLAPAPPTRMFPMRALVLVVLCALGATAAAAQDTAIVIQPENAGIMVPPPELPHAVAERSEEHTSELQSQSNLVCRLLLEKK